MAHEVETAVYRNTPAWHGLGVVFDEAAEGRLLTPREAIRLAELDWEVELVPVEFNGEATGFNLVVRETDDAVFGCVGSRYEPIQNTDAFSMLDQIIDAGELNIESAMSLSGGKRVVIVARRPEELLIGGEKHIPYVMASLSHDGTGAVKFLTPITRVVCKNTLRIALKEVASSYSVKHTRNAHVRLAQAREALKLSYDYSDTFALMGEELVNTKISDRQFDQFLKTLIPDVEDTDKTRAVNNVKRARRGIFEVYTEADNLGNIRGTAWGAFNAVAEYNEHVKSYRDNDRRMVAVMDGTNNNQQAFNLLTSLSTN